MGGAFDSRSNYIFHAPRTVITIFTLLPFLDEEHQHDLLDTFISLLQECTLNCAMSSDVGLMQKLMSLLIDRNKRSLTLAVQQKLMFLIGILGAHNISVRELKGGCPGWDGGMDSVHSTDHAWI